MLIRCLAVALLFALPVRAAELKVLSAGAISSVAETIATEFEEVTGDKIHFTKDTVGGLVRRIRSGESFDVVLMSPNGLKEIAGVGKIAPGADIVLARVGVGIGVKTGSAVPNIRTVEAFKAAMLAARKIAYVDPASGGTSGIYIAKMFQTLGIADAIADKSILVKGGFAAKAVADGDADIAIQQISEIIAVPGVTLAGPLPAEIQSETVYAGAVSSESQSPRAARAFLDMLGGPPAWTVIAAKGMTPP